jgi:hypothetical protein
MFALILVTVISQFKEGDIAYTKSDGVVGYINERLAAIRYQEKGGVVSSSEAFQDNISGGTKPTVVLPKYSKMKVLAIRKTKGDTIIRAQHIDWKDVYWIHAEDLVPDSPEMEKKILEDKDLQKQRELTAVWQTKLKPYITNKNESEAVKIVLAKGFNPIDLKPEQAKDLSASHRRALNNVKMRFRQGKK